MNEMRRWMRCTCAMLFTTALTIGAGTVDAQEGIETRTRVGVIAGLNVANFGGDDTPEDLKSRTALLGGLSLVRARPGALGFEIDALYSMKGAKSTGVFEGVRSEAVFKLSYIELPLLARVEIPTAGGVRPHLVLGPSLALRVGCGAELSSRGASLTVKCEEFQESLDIDLKSFDLGVTAGGGIDFAAGRHTFTVGARYTYGLISIAKNDDTKNRAIQLVLGLSMPLDR